MKRTILYAAAAVAAAGGLYFMVSRKPGESLGMSVGSGLGRLAVGTVDGVVTGAVKATGALVGIPDTNLTQCEKDIAAGRQWDASFSCPATTFIGQLFGGSAREAEINDARQIDRIMDRQGAQMFGTAYY